MVLEHLGLTDLPLKILINLILILRAEYMGQMVFRVLLYQMMEMYGLVRITDELVGMMEQIGLTILQLQALFQIEYMLYLRIL